MTPLLSPPRTLRLALAALLWTAPLPIAAAAEATPASALTVLPGFKVELLRSAQGEEGSWICLTRDAKGRLIISPQADSQPLLRVTLSPEGQVAQVEPVPAPIHQAMGLLYAHDSLYANAHGPEGTGLYRLIDENHNDQFETNEVHFLQRFRGEGEHGYHAVVAGPDGMIYVMNGNFTKVPENISPSSPHKNYKEDFLLPRAWDGNGFAVGLLAPGGQILRADPEGKRWELVLAGFRNAYDFAFNADGEIFTFDSDMEWDWGLPWYRPIRICHCVSGAEFGWRSGSGKMPTWYPDTVPPTLDIGIGSPTGVKFGTGSKFPAKYQKAMYALDWSYGRIFAVHLQPHGASYTANAETFLRGKPLNVTDIEFGQDGAMYFTTGGRGTQSGLYRVSYVGSDSTQPAPADNTPEATAAALARATRHKLESFHGHKDPAAIDFIWPHLNSEDRWLRYAARIALEWQDPTAWQERALSETSVNGSLTALLALARTGSSDVQRQLLQALGRTGKQSLSEDQTLEALRILELAFIRLGKPEDEVRQAVLDALAPYYPSKSEKLNRELSQLLIYLEDPDVVTKTFTLLDAAPTLEEQVHYVFHLRSLKTGWTMEQRKQYFHWLNRIGSGGAHLPGLTRWFHDAGREYDNGASFAKYIINLRKDAIATLSDAERAELKPIYSRREVVSLPTVTDHKFVKEWKLEDFLSDLDQAGQGRSFARGKAAFRVAQCISCHHFGNEGGSVGPDLTAVASRFTRRDIIESILLPSKVVSEQYQNMTFTRNNGEEVTGRLVDQDEQKLVIVTNPLTGEQTELAKADVASRRASKVSPMPEGLVSILTKDEILDLVAYLESGGKESHETFDK